MFVVFHLLPLFFFPAQFDNLRAKRKRNCQFNQRYENEVGSTMFIRKENPLNIISYCMLLLTLGNGLVMFKCSVLWVFFAQTEKKNRAKRERERRKLERVEFVSSMRVFPRKFPYDIYLPFTAKLISLLRFNFKFYR